MTISMNRKYLLVSIALVVKVLFFLFFWFHFNKNFSQKGKQQLLYGIVMSGHDTQGYLDPAQNFFTGKGYVDQSGNPTAFRMPGLAVVYGPLFFFLGAKTGAVLFVFLQLLLGSFSVYYLSKTAYFIFEKQIVFFTTFIVYLFSSFVSIYDHYLLSESFTTYFLIFSVYFFIKYLKNENYNTLLLSGIFVGIASLYRPAVIFVVFSLTCLLLLNGFYNKKRVKKIAQSLLCFGISAFLLLGAWTLRNYLVFEKVIPFVDHGITKSERGIFDLTTAQGANWYTHDGVKGKFFHWYFPSFQSFDGMNQYYDEQFSKSNPFDESKYTPDYNFDSLLVMRNYCWLALDPTSGIDDSTRNHFDKKVGEMAVRFRQSYIKHHLFDFLIIL